MGKMKAPTKARLYEMIQAQQAENLKLVEKMNMEQRRLWETRLPAAFAKIHDILTERFGHLVTLIRYEHCDGSGYWFTFELLNDSRRQTYRINHEEI